MSFKFTTETYDDSTIKNTKDGSIDTDTGGDPQQTSSNASPVGDAIIIDSNESVQSILKENSLNSKKPELLLSARFLKSVSKLKKTSVGKMLEVQQTMRNLKIDDLNALIIELEKDPAVSQNLVTVINNNQEFKEQIESTLALYSSILEHLDNIKKSFDIKQNIESIQSEVLELKSSRDQGAGTQYPIGKYSRIDEIFSNYLHFKDDNFKMYSNSKIIGQLIVDLKNAITEYSPQMLSTFSEERSTDLDPLSINGSKVSDDEFTFGPWDLRYPFDAEINSSFTAFTESLPVSAIDNIKLMVLTLSKELRISAGINKLKNTTLGNKYSVDDPFGLINRIIGNPGDTIVGPIPGNGSIASLTRFLDSNDQTILPFESNVIIDKSISKEYIPGTVFLVDSIISGENKPDIAALSSFKTSLGGIVDDSTGALESLLNYGDNLERLHLENLLKMFYKTVRINLDNIGSPSPEGSAAQYWNESSLIGFALLNAANNDSYLKFLLFDYLLGLENVTSTVTTAETVDNDDFVDTGESHGIEGTAPGNLPGLDELTNRTIDEDGTRTNTLIDNETLDDFNSWRVPRDPRLSRAGIAVDGGPKQKDKLDDTLDAAAVIGADTGLDTISSIMERIFNTIPESNTGTSETNPTHVLPSVTIDAILSDGASDGYSILNNIVILADEIKSLANDVAGDPGDGSPSGFKTNKKTNFRSLRDSSIILLVFESVLSIVSEFISVNFIDSFHYADGSGNGSYTLQINEVQNNSVLSQLHFIEQLVDEPEIAEGYTDLVAGLDSIQESLITEEAVVRDIIDSLKGTASSITKTADETIDFFDINNSSSTSVELKLLFDNEDSNDILDNLSDTQMSLSWQGTETVLSSEDTSFIPNEQIVTEAQYTVLNSLLKEPEFSSDAASNLKLLAVGLPAGMLNTLQTPPFIINKDTVLKADHSDIVTIKIYKRDPEFANIIFKPKEFIFDISRFVRTQLPASTNATFENNLNSSIFLQDIDGRFGLGLLESFSQFSSNAEYNLLTNDQKISIFKNHAISESLRNYLKLMTGVNTAEHTFMGNERLLETNTMDQEVRELILKIDEIIAEPIVEDIVRTVTKPSAILSKSLTTDFVGLRTLTTDVQGLLNNPTLGNTTAASPITEVVTPLGPQLITQSEESTKEVQNQFKRLLNSLIFRSAHNKIRVEQPKLFERTFIVHVDPDEYVIDIEKTQLTRKGMLALNNLTFISNTIEEMSPSGDLITRIKPRGKTGDNFEFSEFFAVVVLGVDD